MNKKVPRRRACAHTAGSGEGEWLLLLGHGLGVHVSAKLLARTDSPVPGLFQMTLHLGGSVGGVLAMGVLDTAHLCAPFRPFG